MTRTPVERVELPPEQEPVRYAMVESTELLAAAQRLAEAAAAGDRDAGRRFLDAAHSQRIDLSNMWASSDPVTGRIREVALGVQGSGRTAMVFTSPPLNRAAEDEVARLIHLVCSEYTRLAGESLRPPVRLAQTLLGPSDSGGARAFESGGFCELARLAYMSRPMPLPSEFQQAAHWDLPTGVRCVRVSELSADRVQVRGILLEALGRSYEHTLDCPELCALREPDDVLDSHLAVGKYDPRWWWVVEAHGQPEGAMLFTPCPEQGGVELVYLGISPDLRGRGIAKVLLRSGMRELSLGIGTKSAKGRLHLSCAVDLKNQPARALYRALGFQMTAERRAFVRAIGS